ERGPGGRTYGWCVMRGQAEMPFTATMQRQRPLHHMQAEETRHGHQQGDRNPENRGTRLFQRLRQQIEPDDAEHQSRSQPEYQMSSVTHSDRDKAAEQRSDQCGQSYQNRHTTIEYCQLLVT